MESAWNSLGTRPKSDDALNGAEPEPRLIDISSFDLPILENKIILGVMERYIY